jgi:hypothetical protein
LAAASDYDAAKLMAKRLDGRVLWCGSQLYLKHPCFWAVVRRAGSQGIHHQQCCGPFTTFK